LSSLRGERREARGERREARGGPAAWARGHWSWMVLRTSSRARRQRVPPCESTASELLGHALVIVPYWEWKGCKGTGEREQYLRSKLAHCVRVGELP